MDQESSNQVNPSRAELKKTRKWFQKKRFLIPIGVFVLAGLGNAMQTLNPTGQGQATAAIPNLSSQIASDAYEQITKLGFENVDVKDASTEDRTVIVKSNWKVCSTSPEGGTVVKTDASIVIFSVKIDETCPASAQSESSGSSEGQPDADTQAPPTPSQSELATSSSNFGNQPESEKNVLSVVEKYKTKYDSAANDLQRADVRLNRDDAICTTNGGSSVSNWVGVVKTIGGNSEGKGYLTVEIADRVTLETWNNALSDIDQNTLIPRSSPLYKKVLDLQEGDIVKFSGSFVPADGSCVNTKNLTEVFAIYWPEFVFKFSDLSKIAGS